jgi:hypothetical protein
MKKIIFIALLLTSVLGMAANWVYFYSNADGIKYYYDSNNISGRTIGDEGHWTWVKIIFPDLWKVDGEYFNVTYQQWVFDCNGNARIDDELFYYNNTLVYKNPGEGEWASVSPDSMVEGLEDLVCR